MTPEVLEVVVFSQPYFDPRGLITAWDADRLVGFAHAGFGCTEDESALATDAGVICAVVVHPDYRRQGIGRELVVRAEKYLKDKGATTLYAGPAYPRDPFYFGVYGGSQPAGFLLSDPDADPFFCRLGYEPVERHLVFQRDLRERGDPVSFRLMTIRRRTILQADTGPPNPTFWWLTRVDRLENVRFLLVPKPDGPPLATVTVVDLSLYRTKWEAQSVGMLDLRVSESHKRQGYGQALIVETCRRLRQELVGLVEAHAPEQNAPAVALLESAGFAQVDTGIVYRKAEA